MPQPKQKLCVGITRVLPDLAQRPGRSPCIADLAVHLRVPEAEVIGVLEYAGVPRTITVTPSGAGAVIALAEMLGWKMSGWIPSRTEPRCGICAPGCRSASAPPGPAIS